MSVSRPGARWPREWFAGDAETIARRLLGRRLVRLTASGVRLSGIIVETEAYLGVRDRASHAFGGRRTPRNEAMYAAPGTLYVYFTYGMHHCANVVCGGVGDPAAVLLRGVCPLEGLPQMRRRRRNPRTGLTPPDARLCDGPGKLCRAFALELRDNGKDLTQDENVWIEDADEMTGHVRRTPRIGLGDCGPWVSAPLRFVLMTPQVRGPNVVKKNRSRR